MKSSILLLLAALSAFLIATFAAVAPPIASGEILIPVNNSTNLNAAYLRVTGSKITLDQSLNNWTLGFRWEAWRSNSTSQAIVRNGELRMTMAELKTLMNAGNPKNALKSAILTDAQLVEAP